MVRVCPRCEATTERNFLCPACGVQTVPQEANALGLSHDLAYMPIERATFGTSVLTGLLVAQCVYYAVRNLATAYLLAAGGPAHEAAYWGTQRGEVLEQSFQAAAVFCGGLIAGAGHRQAAAAGAALGIVNSLLLTGMLLILRRVPNELILFVQPALHAVVGAVGGAVGNRVWQPAPDLAPLPRISRRGEEVLTTVLPDMDELPDIEPLPWGRILIGVALAAGGTVGAKAILEAFVAARDGGHELLNSPFVVWQIAFVAQVAGGGVAGCNTRHGFQYGFWVGALAAGTVVLLLSVADVSLRTEALLASVLGVNVPAGSPVATVLQAGQALLLGILGGWLGGLILPRTLPKGRPDRGAA